MQRTWFARLKPIFKIALPILLIGLCILFDQLSKAYFKNEYVDGERNYIIDNFFYFTFTVNTGAAWSFLADKPWSQTFFKILTAVALLAFIFYFVFSIKKKNSWLIYSLAFVIAGTIGNFIDRLCFNGVTDFIGFIFGDYYFPIFNLADSFLVVGMIMLIFYYCFLDKNAIFKFGNKENKQPEAKEGLEQGETQDGNKDL